MFIWRERSQVVASMWDHLCVTSQPLTPPPKQFKHVEVAILEAGNCYYVFLQILSE